MPRPRIVVTRPAEEAERLVPALEALGCDAVLAPMLEIRALPSAPIGLAGVRAILITSANGARALCAALAASARRDLPVLAVGEASAAAARKVGFTNVESADGDVEALIALVRTRCTPAGGCLLHAAGSVVAGDLKGALEAAGFAVERRVLYEAQAVTALGPGLAAALDDPRTAAVLFFSPRTAETFVTLVRDSKRAGAVARLDAICLSAAVARVAGALSWRRVVVAARPEQAALIEALAGALQASRATADG